MKVASPRITAKDYITARQDCGGEEEPRGAVAGSGGQVAVRVAGIVGGVVGGQAGMRGCVRAVRLCGGWAGRVLVSGGVHGDVGVLIDG